MSNGFRDSQFRRTPGLFSGAGINDGLANPPFNHTPSTVRVVSSKPDLSGLSADQAERALSRGTSVKLQRGYMRNLNTSLGKGAVGTIHSIPQAYRLRFQFNPTSLQQNVEARQDMYLSVLQDPYQLTQPVAASTAFSFELLFDRTHEVMNGGVVANLTDLPGQTTTDNSSGEAADIGVLADLSVLYAIIGQGFTVDTAKSQFNILKDNARREYERAVAQGDPTYTIATSVAEGRGSKTIYTEKSDFGTYFENFLNKSEFLSSQSQEGNVNLGNSAFLVPMPMRIIFSSLYMIDGYVMSTSVMFTKFNTNMVPTQCRVLLNINAVYIGFARDKTFISEAIEKTGNELRQELTAQRKLFNDFCKGYGKYLQDYRVILGDYPGKIVPGFHNQGSGSNPAAVFYASKGSSLYGGSNNVLGGGLAPSITSGFYNAGGGNLQGSLTSSPVVEGGIPNYYKDGGTVSITHKTTVSVYGPYPDKATAAAAGRDATKKVGAYTQSKTSASSDAWVNFSGVKNRDTGAYSVFNKDNSGNGAPNAITRDSFDTEGGLEVYAGKAFSFHVDVEAIITSPDGQITQTRVASQSAQFLGSEDVGGKEFKFTIPPCTEQQTDPNRDPYRDSGPAGGN